MKRRGFIGTLLSLPLVAKAKPEAIPPAAPAAPVASGLSPAGPARTALYPRLSYNFQWFRSGEVIDFGMRPVITDDEEEEGT